ncbi:hypothetical protein ACWIG5_23875 [Streptomyces lydicus]
MISKQCGPLRPAQPGTIPPSLQAPSRSRPAPASALLGAFLHPDFELYDIVGRSTEQINDYEAHTPTSGDQYWATFNATEFADSIGLAESGSGINAWADQLHRARNTDDFHAVIEAVLGDGRSALGALYEFLRDAADWCDRNQEPEIAHRYRSSGHELAQLGDQLAILGEDHRACTYVSVPAHRAQHGQVPVQAPSKRPPRTPPPSAPRRTR